ncbi:MULTISPECIES: AAA family ATPase [unclassified Colwellia]|uniref:AAA family ATPase n=1 Tax=unclassified Colwellia TaxID=196834 RepID=UPI0015F53684|nr:MULTISPECIES: AAA family ATPase [unclassified Colwellia]MBA6357493.1 AAA family ATPase [Colwellia sp. BRX8-3]MBA6361831.1 AAA family ATPase [Colwellia sp. BRX8-6]MBA6369402.1 AAA family ATPase [Colwellia sp. BRX8-5]MBA6376795.1 AAA family ATPase [Colwellia sp. BRX8-2]
MSSAKQDFERFVCWLYQPENQIPVDVRRLANLALARFDELAETTRHRSQRSFFLVDLIRQELDRVADAVPAVVAEIDAGTWPWSKLEHMTLGPFRGFRTPEPFDLSKQITLFYGPNGSGKSSLCEGLEYALLGEVEEAGSKRIAAQTYLTNVHEGRFTPPSLKATDYNGEEIDVVPNADAYRFCFIERNRIDAFSRIASRPNAQRTELIATLFGMEKFNEFVNHFNESIDGQLTLADTQQTTLRERKTALAADLLAVDGMADSMQGLSEEEATLAQEYEAGTTFEALKQLIGADGSAGRLHDLEVILETVPPSILGVTCRGFLDAFDDAHQSSEAVDVICVALQAKSDEVSFKALYHSVLALREIAGDRCPACDTPLDGQMQVAQDPFEKASEGLKHLDELGVLQEQQQIAQNSLELASSKLRGMFIPVAKFINIQNEKETLLGQFIQLLPNEPTGRWWSDIYSQVPDRDAENALLVHLLTVVDRITVQDEFSLQTEQERQPHVDERRRLLNFQLKVQAQELKRQQFQNNIKEAKRRIEIFDETNAVLIVQAAQEKLDIERDIRFKVTYDRFLQKLKEYRTQLPSQLMVGLNEEAMGLYNSFNRNDREDDKLSALNLPLGANKKIEISFQGNPAARVDALHVLSEGHIRCLGLAILMAKAKIIQCPIIVFDDAINAIDHDHRGGIRETIFESDHFYQTQLIVTCHSNEFIKDIQQHLPVQRRSECQVYLLRHHAGNYQPRVTGNITTANYIAKARAAKDILDDRVALGASRQALEMVSQKVWRWLESHDKGLLNLMLPGVGAEPALRDLCNAICKKLREARTFEHANKQPLIEGYRRILGIPQNNLVWTCLNKGIHEEAERDDFDGELVESVVLTLETIDRLDLRPRR